MFGSYLFRSKDSGQEYDALPLSEWGAGQPIPVHIRAVRALKRRRTIAAIFGALVVIILLLLTTARYRNGEVQLQLPFAEELPPLYPEYHRAELELPQHSDKNPFAGGRKYIWFASHVQGALRCCRRVSARTDSMLLLSCWVRELHAGYGLQRAASLRNGTIVRR